MNLLDLITENYPKDSPEKIFADIIKAEYANKFNADEFDLKFSGVAGYKPIKKSNEMIAEKYLDSFDELDNDDKKYAMEKFSEAYDDIASRDSMNVHAIIDGIVEDIIDIDEDDDDDMFETDDDDIIDIDEDDSDSDDAEDFD